MSATKAYAAWSATSPLAPWNLERRALREDDVAIDILFCGVCHADMHFARNNWGNSIYPLVPGHEIVGRVTAIGGAVGRFSVGNLVGVGFMVDSCRHCDACQRGLEQYCTAGLVQTSNGTDRHDGTVTYGGYAERIVVSERFVVCIPDGLDPAVAAPMLCAGISTYSPLRHFGVKAGDALGVVGMGGLGHMAIKFAKAMGAVVTLFTRSDSKVAEAERHGVDRVVVSADPDAMAAAAGTLDTILDTVPVAHDLNPYLATLRLDGTYIIVGQLTPLSPPVDAGLLTTGRRVIAGSIIGGMPETQDVLDFSAAHGIACDIERLDIRDIERADARLAQGDVRYRFVIDMATLKADAPAG